MQNIRLTIQYDGTRYLGWQRPEKDGLRRSVSYKINEILNRMTGEDIAIHAGARTDPGVHALAQTISFQTDTALCPIPSRTQPLSSQRYCRSHCGKCPGTVPR